MFTQGYLPDPPASTDYNFSTDLLPKLAQENGDVDLRWATTATNQYSMSSCVGNATADSVEVLNAIEGRPRVELSRMFVYALCRNMMDANKDGKSDLDRDNGTYIRLAFKVLSKFGVCTENRWPYSKNLLHKIPSLLAMREAIGHKISNYYRITETGDDRVRVCIEALRSNHPVVFASNVGASFQRVRDFSPVSPEDDADGGHAMLMVGYLDGKGFIIKNSWGPGWGDNGFCVMSPDYVSWSQTRDLWVPTKGSTFK